MSNDKLAALLRECLADYSHPHFTDRGGMADRIRAALQAHAAEVAHDAQDAKDAARYRWLKEHDNLHLLAEDVIDEAIAAMAKESGR